MIIQAFDVDIDRLLGTIGPTLWHLARNARIPSGAYVAPVEPGHIEELARLHSDCFVEPLDRIIGLLVGRNERARIDLVSSCVLNFEKRIIGYVLILDERDVLSKFVYAVGVSARHRRSWPNVLLKYECLTRLRQQGVKRIRFEADPTKRDALNHARRSQARVVSSYDLDS